MFIGKGFHQIDDKGRIRMPAKFKDELGDDPVVMQAPNRVLRVYPLAIAEKIFASLSESVEFADTEAGDAQSFLVSNSEYSEVDKQGRILLNKDQITFAELQKEVVIAGAIDHLEIWNKERWEERKEKTNMADVFKALRRKD